MKHFFKIIIFLSLFISLCNANNRLSNLTLEEKKFINLNPIIKIGVEKDWPPFDFVENEKYTGLAKDYLNLIQKRTGLKFEYIVDTWPNLIRKAKNKEIDLLPILAKTKKREEFLLFTNKYISIRDYIFTTNLTIDSIEQMKNKTIAIPKGYVQEEFFKKNHPEINIYLVDSLLDAIDAIITEKADFLVSNIAIVNYLLKKHNITKIKATSFMGYDGNNLHMAVRNDYKILLNIIQKSLDDITFKEKNIISSIWLQPDNNKPQSKLKLTSEELEFIRRKKRIYIANEYDWIPFDFNENGIAKGYVIDYVKLLAKKIGLETVFITDKWSNLIQRFKEEEIDLLPVVSYNKKRTEYLYFTNSFMNQITSIVVKKNRNDIINIDDLRNKKIGMIKGWNSTNILKRNFPNLNIIEFGSLKDVFDAINNNFIDVTIQNELLANYYINKEYRGYLKTSSKITIPELKNELYMGVNKNIKPLTTLLNKAILNVTKEELEILDKKWITYGKEINFTKEEQDFIDNNIIKAIATNSWAPFNFVENDIYKGISIDIFEYVKDKAKLKTEISSTSKFEDVLNSIKNKKNDMILASTNTKDREEYAIFSDTFLSSPIGIATLQDKNFISSAKKLLGKKVAVGKNYSAHKLLEKEYPKMKFVFVNSVKEGLELLTENKVYAFVDIMPVLTYNIKKYGFTNIKISGQTKINFNLKFMFRDDYRTLQSIMNKVLRQMPYEKKQEIKDKWLKVDFENRFDYSLLWKIVSVFLLILIFVLYKNRQLKTYQIKLEKTKNDLENSIENFRTLINFNIAGVLIIQNEKIIYSNDEIAKMLEYPSKAYLADNKLNKILFIKDKIDLTDIEESYDFKAIKADNSTIPILLKSKEINFYGKNAYIISIVDLSEVKKNEEVIIQQSKMASLGEMIANIAHQWRQPLSSISTTASGIRLQKEYGQISDKELFDHLDSITDTTKFLSQTIDDFRNYIKESKIKNEFNISNCIDKVLSIMKASFSNHFINIKKDIKEFKILSYENELNQVLLNILSNSKDALKNIDEEKRFIFINTNKKDDNLIIEIIDTGGGIKKDIISRVFEPYFTTKYNSQGTGLGLYMTHKIITESMNGNIQIENTSYKGFSMCTKVVVSIPLSL